MPNQTPDPTGNTTGQETRPGASSGVGSTDESLGGLLRKGWTIFRSLGPAGIAGALAASMPVLGSVVLFARIEQLGAWLRESGMKGLAAYSGGFAVLAGFALLPTYASAVLGGWAFGFAKGLPAAMAGCVGAALIGYFMGRRVSGERVQQVIAERKESRAVRDALVGGSALKTLGIITLVRVPPNSPFAVMNLVLASVRVPLWSYVVGTLVGMLPRTAFVVWVASSLRELTKESVNGAVPKWFVVAGIVVTILVMMLIGAIGNRAIKRVVGDGVVGDGGAR